MVWQDSNKFPPPATPAIKPGDAGPDAAFAILHHVTPQDTHWDLLLELPGRTGLAAWRIHISPADWLPPPDQSPIWLPAFPLPDHRRIYLDYEGPVSNNRGHVTQIDRGRLIILSSGNNSHTVSLIGKSATLELILQRPSGSDERWLFSARIA